MVVCMNPSCRGTLHRPCTIFAQLLLGSSNTHRNDPNGCETATKMEEGSHKIEILHTIPYPFYTSTLTIYGNLFCSIHSNPTILYIYCIILGTTRRCTNQQSALLKRYLFGPGGCPRLSQSSTPPSQRGGTKSLIFQSFLTTRSLITVF